MDIVKRQDKMSEAERAFWARYADCLVRRNIAGHNAEWHVRRAQEFCYGLNGKRLRDLSPGDVDAYVERLGRRVTWEDWQIRQAISALEVLFSDMTDCQWAAAYDWQAKREACTGLRAEHPTVACEMSAQQAVAQRQKGKSAYSGTTRPAIPG